MAEAVSELLLYRSEDGQTRVDVRLVDETVWLTQAQMAELFDKDVRTISEHIGNVYVEGECEEEATLRKFRMVRAEGDRAIYADGCIVPGDRPARAGVAFKQVPYQIEGL